MNYLESLGTVVQQGVEAVHRMELFSGRDKLRHTYHTHFPLDDGDWELTLRRREPKK